MNRTESFAALRRDPRTAREAAGWTALYQGFGPLAAQMFDPFMPVGVVVTCFDGEEVDAHARAERPNGLGAKVFTYERKKGVRHGAVHLFDEYFYHDHGDEIAAAIGRVGGRKFICPFNSTPALEDFLFRKAPDVLLAQNPVVVRRFFEDKMLLAREAAAIGAPLPPAARIGLLGGLAYRPLADEYPGGFVLQIGFSQHGAGTDFVFTEDDFARVTAEKRAALGGEFDRAQVKITPFMDGPSLNVTGVVTRGGVALSPPDIQIVGDPRFVSVRGQYMGSDFSFRLPDGAWDEVLRIGRRIGDWLGRHGYRGNFGIDLLSRLGGDGSIADVYVSEINARLVGESQYLADFQTMADQVPLTFFHLAEFLRWDVSPADVEAHNAAIRPVRGAAIILYTREKGVFRAAGGLRSGVYKIPPEPAAPGARLDRLRDGWTLSETRADDEIVVTNGVPWDGLVIGHPRYGDEGIALLYLMTRESVLDPADPRRISDRWVAIARLVEKAVDLVPTGPRSLRPAEVL
jgi:hypothetical protein